MKTLRGAAGQCCLMSFTKWLRFLNNHLLPSGQKRLDRYRSVLFSACYVKQNVPLTNARVALYRGKIMSEYIQWIAYCRSALPSVLSNYN